MHASRAHLYMKFPVSSMHTNSSFIHKFKDDLILASKSYFIKKPEIFICAQGVFSLVMSSRVTCGYVFLPVKLDDGVDFLWVRICNDFCIA